MPLYQPPKDDALAKAICVYATKHLIAPADVPNATVGIKSKEPFLISPAEIPQSPDEKNRFLGILAALYRGSKNRFDAAASKVKGSSRTWFGRTPVEVEDTGNSNAAERIPDTPWYVSIGNSGEQKGRIVAQMMKEMGFSADYAKMIGPLCEEKQGWRARLPSKFWEYSYDWN